MKLSIFGCLTSALVCSLLIGACTKIEYTNTTDPLSPNYGKNTSDPDDPNYTNTPPSIRLIGEKDTTIDVSIGETWVDPGVTVTDDHDQNLENSVEVEGTVDLEVNGTYTITYRVEDSGNKMDIARRYVTVQGNTGNTRPQISLRGNNPLTIMQGSTLEDPGFYAYDEEDGEITDAEITSTVDTDIPGEYTMTYTVTDNGGLEASESRTVIVEERPLEDTIPPVVTITGQADVTINMGEEYNDQGATATDITADGSEVDLTGQLEIDTIPAFNNQVAGVYTFRYRVSDEAGNQDSESRTVTVIDTSDPNDPSVDNTPPVIKLEGKQTITHELGTEYVDPGATAEDNVDGVIPPEQIVIDASQVENATKEGRYYVHYHVTDAAGNEGTTRRVVLVVENTSDQDPPVITLLGDNPLVINIGDEVVDPGAEALDETSGDRTEHITMTHNVDNEEPGSYTMTYRVTDAAGNEATKTREVVVLTEGGGEIIDLSENGEKSVDGTTIPMTFNVPAPLSWSASEMHIRITAESNVSVTLEIEGGDTFTSSSSGYHDIVIPNEACTFTVTTDAAVSYTIKYGG